MNKLLALSAAVLMTSTVASAGEQLAIGDFVGAFHVKDVTGPAAGRELCYRCRFGNRPVVTVFARRMTEELTTLIAELNQAVGRNADREMAAFVVLLADDPAEHEQQLRALAEAQDVRHVPLTTFDDAAGPRGYLISPDADVTVMMWVEGELQVNEIFADSDLTGETIARILQDTDRILD